MFEAVQALAKEPPHPEAPNLSNPSGRVEWGKGEKKMTLVLTTMATIARNIVIYSVLATFFNILQEDV